MLYYISVTLTFILIISISILNYYNNYEYFNNIQIFKKMLSTNNFKYIIDVRTNQEYQQGHYPNSINIPIQKFNIEQLKKKIPNINKNDNILIYCKSGRRAKIAYQKLKKNNFNNVYYLKGNYQLLLDD